MSSQAEPITPHHFAQALQSLTLPSLHTKAAELHNSIAHLQASNAQLAPFAVPPGHITTSLGDATSSLNSNTNGNGTSMNDNGMRAEDTDLSYDQDCADAIAENEEVIVRMRTRLELLKAEVQERGAVWVWGELDDMAAGRKPGEGIWSGAGGGLAGVNGHVGLNGHAGADGVTGHAETDGAHSANGDGNAVAGNTAPRRTDPQAPNRSGRLTDEELRHRIQQYMDELGDDEDGGMHL